MCRISAKSDTFQQRSSGSMELQKDSLWSLGTFFFGGGMSFAHYVIVCSLEDVSSESINVSQFPIQSINQKYNSKTIQAVGLEYWHAQAVTVSWHSQLGSFFKY